MSGSNYRVYLDNNETIVLNENIIIKYNLLIRKEIDDINKIIKDNNNYMVYELSLKYINVKMRSESEIVSYLKKKDIDSKVIENTIKKLKENGFINDRLYTKSFISDKIRINNYGLDKIKSQLLKLKIDRQIIEEELKNVDRKELNDNLEKLIDKKIRTNRSYAGDVLKQKILIDFINKGYYKEDILKILNFSFLSCQSKSASFTNNKIVRSESSTCSAWTIRVYYLLLGFAEPRLTNRHR